MKNLILLLIILTLQGCALGAATSATAGFALTAKSADELSPRARQSIIDDVMTKVKDYVDNYCRRINEK